MTAKKGLKRLVRARMKITGERYTAARQFFLDAKENTSMSAIQVKDPLYILYVHDMDRALAFYRDTFDLEVVQHTPGWSMLRCGGTTIALHILSSGNTESVTGHAGLSLQVTDLDAAIATVVAAGGTHIATREATDFVPVRMCELKDTEGNGFELRQFVAEGEDLAAIE